MSRSFSVVQVGGKNVNYGGRYLSETPSGAAKKAGSRLLKNRKSVKVMMMETTRGSNNKEYSYVVKKVQVNKLVVRDGVEVLYRFKTVVKAV
jgi:hypothetical protein